MEYWKQELYHHGILGMKWGKRNGPPYPLSPGQHSESEKKAGWRKSLKESRADRARTEADSARKIAKRYTDSMDKKANKRQAQYEAKPTRNRKLKAERARDEANTAKNIASKYTNAMDRKAEKRTNQARVGANKSGSRWVSDDQSNLGIIADTAFTALAVTAATGVVFLGMQYYKNGGFGNLANIPMSSIIDAAKNTVKANKESVIANAAVFSAIKLGHKYMNRSGFDNNSNSGSILSENKAGATQSQIKKRREAAKLTKRSYDKGVDRKSMTYKERYNEFLDSYSPKKNSPNSLFDIDDEEIIEFYMDEPEFRKEYGVSDADYKIWKEIMS